MASSIVLDMEGINQLGQGSAASDTGSSMHVEEAMPTFLHQQTISPKWTDEEQAILEEGLEKYASESNMMRYAKIAAVLDDKKIRDVAFRCNSITKKEIGKTWKEDLDATKGEDRKDIVVEAATEP